jgi:hypothetical protein
MVLKVVSGGNFNGPIYYQGTWDANANNPFLQSGVGFTGEYYIVSVAGNTTLDGISNWQVGDWAIFNSATNKWEKIDGGSYGTTLNIVNDSSSNTAYNIVLTNSTGGLVDSEYIDNGHLTFNPSTKTLSIIDTTNESTPFYSAVNSYYGSSFIVGGCDANDEWIHGSILGDSAIRANSGNLALGSTSGRTIIGTKLNTSVIININGALSFGSSTPNYGSSGQVLVSQGTSSPVWSTPANGTVVSISSGTGITATPNPITSTGTIAIANTTVTAGTYGNASAVSQVVINAQGQVTSASNVTISVPSGQVTGLGTMATQNSNNVTITGGSINVQTTNHTATTTGNATYATSSLLLVPAGFFEIDLNGTVVKVPYYAV